MNGTATCFLYDGGTLLAELDASGNVTSLNTWGVTGLAARSFSTRTLLHVYDASGNLSEQVDASSGSVVATYAFDGYGGRTVSSSDSAATSDPCAGYGSAAGYYTDNETGLTLCGHRYYDSANGRWLTRDPIGYEGGVNLYSYCGNNGVGGSDPSGLVSTFFGHSFNDGLGDELMFVFDAETIGNGILTWGKVLGNMNGGYSGGQDEPGYRESEFLTNVGMACLMAADGLSDAGFEGGGGGGGGSRPGFMGADDIMEASEEAALRRAARMHGVNEPFEVERYPQYGKNPNLVGPNGEPWETVYVTDGTNEATIKHHCNGHKFSDETPPKIVPGHYHGPNNDKPHIYYPKYVWK